ncbi:hypothetical protein H8R29_28455 (plasmid) [Priestia megaterium]|uniref:Protein YoqH n=1 Tax=Priestia megaterium (strain ATCC 14581 / DSM 32 / CCUG 1817 / JCM 2506 / NBRC 15308 / NCIMB 9376 / NCTC 10342 / NRRL B-14308 / VKM B-512 / Ford 19) TaxID=1348623 RepID=A0A0B6AX45_PRIM2|nr:hypothetical protein [Priestia megaterium]AJI25692.1 hypothetical protein BG04_5873 [Priestia megaterium NBRC 15308 = ATCC 14581]KFM95503.1 hypothetical protein DJ91_5552 [Priestia megaterium]KGJ81157.1 hypothetical protein BMT_18135 [Priestia megaterium NBRC 15308 = ATCC 14581]MDR4229822.1 hypothetical protein [Priestia megaterium]MED3809742.1 hypothetical protein [Priestia megaterium]
MKKLTLVIVLSFIVLVYPYQANASKMPCSLILEPIDKHLKNAKDTALIYKVQLNPPSFPRTNISILGVHLPKPSSYGRYDGYEGVASVPNEVSWRFRMYPTPEDESPTWAGRFDLITVDMKNVKIQIRLSNSKTEKLGPPILQARMALCK